MSGIARLMTYTVSVEKYLGTRNGSNAYADPVDRKCFPNNGVKLTRQQDGTETVSQTTLYVPLEDAGDFAPGSKVTLEGRTAHVITVLRRDVGPLNAQHAQVSLT